MMHFLMPAAMTLLVLASQEEPYSCKEFHEAQRKCSYNTTGPCYVQRDLEHYRQQCIRDGGRP
jgi:hypothetical protein